MAGESGERKRLPKRRSHGGGEEGSIGNSSEGEKIQTGLVTRRERRGKENSTGKVSPAAGEGKMEEDQELNRAEQTDPSIFFDEDSNHIFPVEQFFGNLNTVQMCWPWKTRDQHSLVIFLTHLLNLGMICWEITKLLDTSQLSFPLRNHVATEFSRKATATEGMSRREYRRRHFFAKEDSDEENT